MLDSNINEFLKELYRKTLAGNDWSTISTKDINHLMRYKTIEVFSTVFNFNEKFYLKILLEIKSKWENITKNEWVNILNHLKTDQEIRGFIIFFYFIINTDGLLFFQKYWEGSNSLKKQVKKLIKRQPNLINNKNYFLESYEIKVFNFSNTKGIIES